MRIAISLLNFRSGKIGGTETYLRRLIPRLAEAASDHELMLLMNRQQNAENLFPGVRRSVVDMGSSQVLVERGLEAMSNYRSRAAEKALDRMRADIVLFPQQAMFPKHVAAPSAVVVHDLYHIFLPQNLSPLQRFVRKRSYTASVYAADRIVAISEFTKDSVVDHYGIEPDRISVIPHGVEPVSHGQLPADSVSDRPYLYYPATSMPHKNHAVLLETIAKLKAMGRFNYELILSGIQTDYWKTLRRLIHKLGLEHTVRHLGFLPYERVQRLFRGAECILFPTAFEGFGLPVTEAVEARKKIIVSRLEIFRELGVPQRFQIDFSDPEQLDAAIRMPGITTLHRPPWTWQRVANATLEMLLDEVSYTRRGIPPMRTREALDEPAELALQRVA